MMVKPPRRVSGPPDGFAPELCGRLMDFAEANDVSPARLRAEAESRRRAARFSGEGKNMGALGSFDPSQFADTFVGNFRRARVYKTAPASAAAEFEYGLDERGVLLSSLRRAADGYASEAYLAGERDGVRIYACFLPLGESAEKKALFRLLGYRFHGERLSEAAHLEYIGDNMTGMEWSAFSYDESGALRAADTCHLTAPGLYDSPIAQAIGFPGGLSIPTIIYRGVEYLAVWSRVAMD